MVGEVKCLKLNTATAAPAATPFYYRTAPRKPKVRKTTVLFGTSITKYIHENIFMKKP